MTNELAIEPEMPSEISPAQMELLLGEPVQIDYSKPEGNYTAERLWRDRPDIAKAAIKFLAEPREAVSYRRIMHRLHISFHTLRALEISNKTDIAKEKKTLGDLMYSVSEAYAEQALATVGSAKGKDAVLASAIATDKHLQLRGEAIGKIEVHHKIDVTAKIDNAFKEIMTGFEKMKRATVIEATPLQIAEATD